LLWRWWLDRFLGATACGADLNVKTLGVTILYYTIPISAAITRSTMKPVHIRFITGFMCSSNIGSHRFGKAPKLQKRDPFSRNPTKRNKFNN